jgi:hypothetical protein
MRQQLLDEHVRKGHELVALATFLGLYGGVLGLYLHRVRASASFLLPALAVVFPLLAVGASQLALYLGQRDLGWVDVSWRELGVPFWLSFAFWQWLALACLAAGLGLLVALRPSPSGPVPIRGAPAPPARLAPHATPGSRTLPG